MISVTKRHCSMPSSWWHRCIYDGYIHIHYILCWTPTMRYLFYVSCDKTHIINTTLRWHIVSCRPKTRAILHLRSMHQILIIKWFTMIVIHELKPFVSILDIKVASGSFEANRPWSNRVTCLCRRRTVFDWSQSQLSTCRSSWCDVPIKLEVHLNEL